MFGESSGDLTPLPYSSPSPMAADGADGVSAATVREGDGGGDALQLGVEAEMSCLLYTSPSPRDGRLSRMPSSA